MEDPTSESQPVHATSAVWPKVALFVTSGGQTAHLLRSIHAEWRKRAKPFYQASAVCGARSRSAILAAELPDNRRLCEYCLFPREQPVVYQVFDADNELIYVGYSGRLLQRLDQHRNATHWWHEAVRVTWTEFDSTVDALVAELELAREHRPRWNSPSGRRPGRVLPPSKRHLYAEFAARIA